MPAKKRHNTKYPGVYFINSKVGTTGKPEKIYYIMYRKKGRLVEERAGYQFRDDMTPARAARLRGQRMEGKQKTNRERKDAAMAKKKAKASCWTISRLWAEYKRQTPGLKGIVTDENRFKNYLDGPFGDKEPKDIIQLDVDRMRIKLLKKRAPQTVKHILALLKRIINFGVKKGLCPTLSFTFQMPRVDNIKTEDLNPEQLARLMEAIEADPHRQVKAIFKMVLYTGMRKTELLRLHWKDVDFDRGFITIRDPKGGASQIIPMNDEARNLLKAHHRTTSPFVFPNPEGGQYKNIRYAVHRIRDNAGLPKDFRPLHGLRHVYASMLASSGQVDMYTLQRLMTHKSPIMTQRYAHLRDETLRKASGLAGDLINQAVSGARQDKVVNLESHKK